MWEEYISIKITYLTLLFLWISSLIHSNYAFPKIHGILIMFLNTIISQTAYSVLSLDKGH